MLPIQPLSNQIPIFFQAEIPTGGYRYPEWLKLGSAIRVVFPPHPEVAALPETQLGPQVGTKSGLSRNQVQILEFAREERSIAELMEALGWRNRTKFRNRFIRPLIDAGCLVMTIPDKPRSSKRRERTQSTSSL